MTKLFAFCLLFLTLTAFPSMAGTVAIGFDDAVGLDYDYQDFMFTLSSPSLQLNSSGDWVRIPPVLTTATYSERSHGLLFAPYFNQTSSDGSGKAIGFCIWGGGTCNGGVAAMPNASYLTTDPNSISGSANDVTFTTDGSVDAEIFLNIAAGADLLGWYNVSTPSNIHWLNSLAQPVVGGTFSPNGDFGLVGRNTSLNFTLYTQTNAGGDSDVISHFAYFTDQTVNVDALVLNVTPEPGSVLLGFSAIAAIAFKLRKKTA